MLPSRSRILSPLWFVRFMVASRLISPMISIVWVGDPVQNVNKVCVLFSMNAYLPENGASSLMLNSSAEAGPSVIRGIFNK